jgi:5-formyltetrahydrofolate cyclo-ligase
MTNTSSEQKSLLRTICKRDRQNLSHAYKKKAEALIHAKFLLYLKSTNYNHTIGFYYPTRDEFDTIPLLETLSNQGTKCLLPKVEPESMEMDFYEWSPNSKMIKNSSLVFLEPYSNKKGIPTIIIAPLLTCDLSGNRLGYGKGLYDQYLVSHNNIIKIAFCYEKLLSKDTTIPSEEHDQRIDVIFTENQTIYIS